MLNSVNPDMLLLARESRGLSQNDLATKLNISQGKLSKAEKGEQRLNDDILEALANITNYPTTFFYQPSPDAPVSHHYYRRRITINKKVIVQLEANIKTFRSNIDELMEAVEMPDYNIPAISTLDKSAEEIAQLTRFKLKIPKGPIGNLVNILENNGVMIVKTDLFTDKIDGLSTISEKGTRIIFLNERMSNDRQRFSLAHELGHLIMHFDIPAFPDAVEDEANIFASEFLMPRLEIKNSLRFLTFAKLGELKRYWKVSMRALVERAKSLEAITPSQYRNFQINFSKRGITKSEPILLPEEKPFIKKEIVNLHLKELGYSIPELARIVNLSENEFCERFIDRNPNKLKVVKK